MRKLTIYVDASVIGGCADAELAVDSLALWTEFARGTHTLALSDHTLRELEKAPEAVRQLLLQVPPEHQIVFTDSPEAAALA